MSAPPPPEPLASPVLVPELDKFPPVHVGDAIVMSGVEPKPVWLMDDGWQAVSRSARVDRGLTPRR